MSPEQYEHWKDFAFRMVDVAVSARKRKPSRQMVRDNMAFFFECRMDPYEEWRRVIDWDNTKADERGRSYPVCDHLADMQEYWIPDYWAHIDDSEAKYEKLRERWVDPAACCIRAGLDFASAPSAGVLGFTAGDLRLMYPEGVPEWVTGGDAKWCPWLREHDDSECDAFADLPDDVALVL